MAGNLHTSSATVHLLGSLYQVAVSDVVWPQTQNEKGIFT